jgi:hypothetical protein
LKGTIRPDERQQQQPKSDLPSPGKFDKRPRPRRRLSVSRGVDCLDTYGE